MGPSVSQLTKNLNTALQTLNKYTLTLPMGSSCSFPPLRPCIPGQVVSTTLNSAVWGMKLSNDVIYLRPRVHDPKAMGHWNQSSQNSQVGKKRISQIYYLTVLTTRGNYLSYSVSFGDSSTLCKDRGP